MGNLILFLGNYNLVNFTPGNPTKRNLTLCGSKVQDHLYKLHEYDTDNEMKINIDNSIGYAFQFFKN